MITYIKSSSEGLAKGGCAHSRASQRLLDQMVQLFVTRFSAAENGYCQVTSELLTLTINIRSHVKHTVYLI